jgi:hypothetical protein
MAVSTLNYVTKDYASIRENLLKQIGIITKGRYTNLNESDPLITIIELYMSMVDNMLFYQDMMVQELYLPTAKQRRNVINLMRLIGYEFRGTAAATATITLNIMPNTFPVYPVTIKKGTQFAATSALTNKQLLFTSTTEGKIFSASDQKIIPLIQGAIKTESFTADGAASYKIRLSDNKIEKNSLIVKIDETNVNNTSLVPWSKVETFYNSNSTDTVYKVQIDEFSKASIIFGDGIFGKIPVNGAKIYVEYIATDGSDGNIGQNAIISIISGYPYIYDGANKPAQLSIRTSTGSAGGEDPESIEEAKEAGLGQLFSQRRALTREDFLHLTEAISGVDKAIAWGETEESSPDYRLMNLVKLVFFSEKYADMYYNPASLSSYKSLRDNVVKPQLLEKVPITTKLSFIDPVIVDIFMWLQIGVDTTRYDPTIVADEVKSSLLDFYSFSNTHFGQDIRLSDIHKTASAVDGVSWVRINRLHTTPNGALPDTAVIPPIDLVLEKWKLPTVMDISIKPSEVASTVPATTPYISAVLSPNISIGLNNITVENPDAQSDIKISAFTSYPTSETKHIIVTYTEAYDSPNSAGGLYGMPAGQNDSFIFASNR